LIVFAVSIGTQELCVLFFMALLVAAVAGIWYIAFVLKTRK
jgi:hypothetical protein